MRIVRMVLLVSVGALLAGCGADGEPIQPTMSANIGVGSGGTYGGVGVGLRKGGFGISLGL